MTTRHPGRILLFAFLGWTFDFYDLVLLGFLKDRVGADLHLTATAEAWLLGVALGTSGVGGIVAGLIADRIGKRTMLTATILTYSFGSLVCGLAPSLAVFVLGRAIVGLGVGGEWAIGHGMVAESVRPEVRGRAAAALQSGEPVGVAIAAFVGYVVLPRVGWRVVLVASSASAILALVARRSIQLPNERSERPPTWADIRRAHIGRRAVTAWVLGVLKLGTYWSCYLWLPSFLRNEMHQDVGHSLAWMFTAQVGQLVGMLTFGWVSDRIGRRPAFAIYSSITACALVPLAYAWPTLAGSPALFWSAMLTLGFGSGCTAGFGALLAELFPTEVRATAMGAVYNLARAVQVVAPVLVGWAVAVAEAGLAGGLTVPLVLAVATACWVWVLPETRGIALPTLATSER